MTEERCTFCGLPAVTWADAIAHFGGGMGTPLCEWCDEINDQLWDFRCASVVSS